MIYGTEYVGIIWNSITKHIVLVIIRNAICINTLVAYKALEPVVDIDQVI